MLSFWSVVIAVVIFFAVHWLFSSVLPSIRQFRMLTKVLKDVGAEKPHWLLGHLRTIRPDQESILYQSRELAKKFPKCTQLWFGPVICYLSFYHPDLLKTILKTEEPKDDLAYKYIRAWIGDGLLTSHGNKWRRNRRLLSPAFHHDMLRTYLECTNNVVTEMLEKWSTAHEGSISVELFHDVSLMALDNLLRCMLSFKSNCQHGGSSEYLESVKTVTEIVIRRFHNPFYQIDCLFQLTPMGRRDIKALKIAHEFTESIILARKANMEPGLQKSTRKLDFLDILLSAKDEKGIGLTHQEICDEVDTIVFAGHDTVTSAISFALYNLAKHPRFQEKCRDEAQDVVGEREHLEWGDLSKLNYLGMFIKESLRLYPSVAVTARKTSQPIFFPRGFGSDQYNTKPDDQSSSDGSRTLPPGINISTNLFVLHRNPVLWKDVENFDPERFTQENVGKRSPQAYLPFSTGPRTCIGQNFALNELKVVLALALLRFRLSLDDTYPEPELEPHIVLRTKNGIHIKVEELPL